MKKQILSRMAALAILTGASVAYADHIKFSDLPANVQKTVNAQKGTGVVGEIDTQMENGKTVYKVEIKADGQTKPLYVSDNGAVLHRDGKAKADANIEVGKDTRKHDILDKHDGKILGIIPAPGHKDRTGADVNVNDNGVSANAHVNNDKNDGTLGGIAPAPSSIGKGADAEIRTDSSGARVDVNTDRDRDLRRDEGITSKHDGKILGVLPAPSHNKAGTGADVDVHDNGVSANARVNNDKNDGKLGGVLPAPSSVGRGADAEVRTDSSGARVDVNTDHTRDGSYSAKTDVDLNNGNADVSVKKKHSIFSKNDGKILGLFPAPSAKKNKTRTDMEMQTDRSRLNSGSAGTYQTDTSARELGNGETKITLDQLPSAVRDTIKREAGSGTVGKIERENHKGKTVYEVEITKNGSSSELHVAPDGRVVKDVHKDTSTKDRSSNKTK